MTDVKITKDMLIGEVVENYPQIVDRLEEAGVHCVGCGGATMESLGDGLRGHGMAEEEVDSLVTELNEIASYKPQEGQIEVTDIVFTKAKELLKKQFPDKPNMNLRIGVLPGGCSGMTYDFAFDDEIQADDLAIEKDGFKVLIDQESLQFLNGAKIDYVESLHGSGFKVQNPNAKGGCGCGKSFN